MELIVLALILLIVGVGSTYLYDRYKVHMVFLAAAKAEAAKRRQAVEDERKRSKAAFDIEYQKLMKAELERVGKERRPSKGVAIDDLSKLKSKSTKGRAPSPIRQKKILLKPVKASFSKEGDLPTVAEYVEEANIDTRKTIDDLITKLQNMKKD